MGRIAFAIVVTAIATASGVASCGGAPFLAGEVAPLEDAATSSAETSASSVPPSDSASGPSADAGASGEGLPDAPGSDRTGDASPIPAEASRDDAAKTCAPVAWPLPAPPGCGEPLSAAPSAPGAVWILGSGTPPYCIASAGTETYVPSADVAPCEACTADLTCACLEAHGALASYRCVQPDGGSSPYLE